MTEPVVVSWGAGVNSTALLIGMHERGERPDLVLMADTGGEKPETLAFVLSFQQWLESVGFPSIIIVQNAFRPGFRHRSLEDECHNNRTLPSLAFGFKGCSVKWKRQPMDRYVRQWSAAQVAWEAGLRVRRLIGIDAGEPHRGKIPDDARFAYHFPLIEWDWGRRQCLDAIDRAGLCQPPKSACFFCPAMRPGEILQLKRTHPDLVVRAIAMEESAAGGLSNVKGLGRAWSWQSVIDADSAQWSLFPEVIEQACLCFDGDDL